MTNAEFKQALLETGLFSKRNSQGQYRCKTCPYCGDTHNHMYVKIDLTDDACPVLVNCKKCKHGHVIDQKFLDFYGLDRLELPNVRRSRRIRREEDRTNSNLLDQEKDAEMIRLASEYIEYRVGVMPSLEDLKNLQVIGNPYQYARLYLGGDTYGLQGRVWFSLNTGGMSGRQMIKDGGNWRKRNPNDKAGAVYVIGGQIDTYQTINVVICEGIMDAIGLYYHSGISNAIYIACLGRDYMLGAQYAIRRGIYGYSVNVKIFKDNDVSFVSIPKKYRKLFKQVNVYHNTLWKDFGVHADKIEIEKCM